MLRLCIEGVSYARQTQPLFHQLNAEIQAGQLLLLEGANGVGKTTLLKMIGGLIEPDQGHIQLHHHDGVFRAPFPHYQAWLGHRNALKEQLSAVENLRYLHHSTTPTDQAIFAALDAYALFSSRHRPLSTFSQGMKRRVALASLSLSHAPLWLMDEPQASLDKDGITCFEASLTRHLQQGGLGVMATHHGLGLDSERVVRLVLSAEGIHVC